MLKAGKADLPDLARLLTVAGQQGKPRRSNLCKRDKLENLDFFSITAIYRYGFS